MQTRRPRIEREHRHWKYGVLRVLARAEGYAMVRYKRALPFVVSEAELDVAPEAAGYDDVLGQQGKHGQRG
jgi:hypothetical protein